MKRAGLVALGLVMIAGPRLTVAAVVVAEPNGNADAAFLAELRASLETVAAEAPAEMNAELRASAMVKEQDIVLDIELVPGDGKAPIRETRVASKASALAQARAMGREAVKALIAPGGNAASAADVAAAKANLAPATPRPSSPATEPAPATVQLSGHYPETDTDAAAPIVERADLKLRDQPLGKPTTDAFDRHSAILASWVPTGVVSVLGLVVLPIGQGDFTVLMTGLSIACTGLTFGPSVGYFWLGQNGHAVGMASLRLAASAVGISFLAAYITTFSWGDSSELPAECIDYNGEDIPGCSGGKSHPGYLVTSIIGFTSLLVAAFVDAALVGRAADRVNAEWRKKNKPMVQVTPVAWTNGRDDTTYGLALRGAF